MTKGERPWYQWVKRYIVPLTFPPFFALIAPFIPLYGQNRRLTDIPWLGNTFSWIYVASIYTWAAVWLVISGPKITGPKTSFGQTPVYQNNGLLYFFVTTLVYSLLMIAWPQLALNIYSNAPEIITSLNIVALVFCLCLTIKGTFMPAYREQTDAPSNAVAAFYYKFWCGAELHPRLFGFDIKQLTNCRVGCMLWQLLPISYFAASTYTHGLNIPLLVNIIILTVYLFKFYLWEDGYFHTLDIIEDRAGFYLCWGCLVFVPAFYTWPTYYMTTHPPTLSLPLSALCLALGLLSILMNYLVDLEKQMFKKTGKTFFNNHPSTIKGVLLTSGFWGSARHLNYTFEILFGLFYCLPGISLGLLPFLYFFFVTILLLHRIYRDNRRCSLKYGKSWQLYCQKVPYILIPYIF